MDSTFDVGGLLGGIATAIASGIGTNKTNRTNKEIADATNASNERIARETNEFNYLSVLETNRSNKEMNDANNALQVELAEKSYQRSTASNQIAELIKAGFSPQQAKSIVGGSGSPATMPMPTTTAPVAEAAQAAPYEFQGYQYTDPGVTASAGIGEAVNALGSIMNQYVNDCRAADGGYLGAEALNPIATAIYDLIGQGLISPDDLYGQSPLSFRDMCFKEALGDIDLGVLVNQRDEDGNPVVPDFSEPIDRIVSSSNESLFELFTSKEWKRLTRTPYGRNAWRNFVNQFNTDGTTAGELRLMFKQERLKQYELEIEALKRNIVGYEEQIAKGNLGIYASKYALEVQTQVDEAIVALNTAAGRMAAATSPKYQDAVEKEFFSNQNARAFAAMVQEMYDEGVFTQMSEDPFLKSLYTFYHIANENGLLKHIMQTQDEVASVAKAFITKGVDMLIDSWNSQGGKKNPTQPVVTERTITRTGKDGNPYTITEKLN